jgi:hypothetical protein
VTSRAASRTGRGHPTTEAVRDFSELSHRLSDLFQCDSCAEIPTTVVKWREADGGRLTLPEHLRRVLPDRCRSITEIRIQILKRHRTRCTFEIEWPGRSEGRVVIGKVYEAERADIYHAMDAIRRAGFGPDAPFSIPEPLAYIPEWRLLLMEKVTGPRAKHVFLSGTESDRQETAERCADWLARFQVTAPHRGEPYRVSDVLDSVDEWSQFFRAGGGVLAEKAMRLRDQLQAAACALEPTEPCAGHGHYTCGQILMTEHSTSAMDAAPASTGREVLAGSRTVAFDWDGYDVADPCRDVASFLVDLERLAWKTPACRAALDHATEIFLQTYFALCPGRGSNLPFYAAALCLRLATRDVGKHSAEQAATMLDEGLRVLEQGLSSWSNT